MGEADLRGESRSLWDRWAPAAGIAYVVTYIAAITIVAAAGWPESGDPGEDLLAFYSDERGTVIATSLLSVCFLGFFVWFATALASRLREGAEHGLSSVVAIGSAAYVGLSLASLGFVLGLVASGAYRDVEPGFAKAVEAGFDGIWMLAWMPLALVVLAFGIGAVRARIAPGWFAPASAATAVVFLLGTTTWAETGFWSPFGGYVIFIVAALVLWPLTTSALLLRWRDRSPERRAKRSGGGGE